MGKAQTITFSVSGAGLALGLTLLEDYLTGLSGVFYIIAWIVAVLMMLAWPTFYFYEKFFVKKTKQTSSIPAFLPMWKFQANWWLPYWRLIPMKRAVQISYKKTMDNLASKVAEEGFGGKLIIESYYANALADSGQTPIFGYKYGTRRFAKIPPDTFNKGTFSDDADSFSYFEEQQPRYVGLAIRKDDLKRRIKEIKDWDGDS